MNYAAAINDNNDHYFDDERKEGIVAPPTFAAAVSWPIVENLPEYIVADDFPFELFMTTVHYSEHLKIHRLMKPGDKLTIKGKIVAIVPHRAGTHVILCLKTIDENNQPVFTQYHGGMLRGVQCVGEGTGEDQIPKVPSCKGNSSPLWRETITIDPLRSYIYDGCTGITFPIHTSKEFAHQVGLPGIIMQGTATLAFVVRELTNKEAGGNPSRIKEMACKFTSTVLPGTDLQIVLNDRIRTGNNIDLFFNVSNDREKKAISDGYVRIENFIKE